MKYYIYNDRGRVAAILRLKRVARKIAKELSCIAPLKVVK